MSYLNDYTEETSGVIHLMITTKCNRFCKHCCNRQYDLSQVPVVTDCELRAAHTVFLTGGEPFAYANPCCVAKDLKSLYYNLERVMVYSNALELAEYLKKHSLYSIDGLTVSIKTPHDKMAFDRVIVHNFDVMSLSSNWLYVFPGIDLSFYPGNFEVFERTWQEDFKPAGDSVFRKLGDVR